MNKKVFHFWRSRRNLMRFIKQKGWKKEIRVRKMYKHIQVLMNRGK